MVVIDPKRTRTMRTADITSPPPGGTDGALALGIAVIVTERAADEVWLAEHTASWPALRARIMEHPPERVRDRPGCRWWPEVVALARLYAAEARPVKIARRPANATVQTGPLAPPAADRHNGTRGRRLAIGSDT